jgi:acetoin utilization protein AcuB
MGTRTKHDFGRKSQGARVVDGTHNLPLRKEETRMLVKDRMSSPALTIAPDMQFQDALTLMRERQFRRLPVTDGDGRLVGIVSERDLLYASPSSATSLSIWEIHYLLSKIKVRSIMSTDVVTTTSETPLEDAAFLMADKKIGGLPVVDEHNRVIGVITETDIFKTFVEMFAGGHSGLRLTLQVPDRNGVLLGLCQAVSELGGSIMSVGSFYGAPCSGTRGLVAKLRNVDRSEFVSALEALGDQVIDARDV